MEPEQTSGENYHQHSVTPSHTRRNVRKKVLFITISVVLLTALLLGWHAMNGNTSVVPKKIQQAVNFSIYYPGDVPPGYVLNVGSFRLAEPGVVLFTVTHDKSKDIVFSEQQQPSSGDIDKFTSSYMPLNSVVQLPLGQAKVGAYGSAPAIRTVVSVPIQDGPWLIATAPSDISQNDLILLMKSLTR